MTRLLFFTVCFFAGCPAAGFAEPVRIVSQTAPNAVQPQVAVAPDGEIHVVFGRGASIFHTRSRDGRAFSSPVKVGELEKLALGMRRGPRVSASEKTISVTAISHADGMLHAWTSGDDGATWNAAASLNTVSNSAREGLHAMAADGRGLLAVTWLDLRNKGTEIWSRVSRDGGLAWQPEVRVYASPDGHVCECCQPGVAIGPAGEIGVMWRNWLGGARDMWMSLSTDGGGKFGEARKLGEGTWRLNGCPMDGGALAFAATGKPVAVWRREKTVYFGEVAGSENFQAAGATQPVIVFEKSGATIVWEQNGALMMKRAASALPARLADAAAFPSAAATPGGGAVVVWESRGDPGAIYLESW